MGIQISTSTTTAVYSNNNSSSALPMAKFALYPTNPEGFHYNGYSAGSVDSNTELLNGAMRQWADQNGVKLSDKEISDLSELMAIKMHMKNLDPNSAEYRAYGAREKELSQELIPTAARLASEIYSDSSEKNTDMAMTRMQQMMKDGINQGISDPDAWLKDFKQNLRQMPEWADLPESIVDSFSKYVRSMVQQLGENGSSAGQASPGDNSATAEGYAKEAEEHFDDFKDAVQDYLEEAQGQFFPSGANGPQYYLPVNSSDSNTLDLDRMLKDFIIQSISDSYSKSNGGSGNGSNGSNRGGYSITINPIGLSGPGGSQPVGANLQYNPSSGPGNNPGDGSIWDTGASPNNSGAKRPSSSSSDDTGGDQQFDWSTSNGGSFFHALLALAKRLADDYQKYTEGINADKFDMQSASEFQVKTMQFTTCFGAINKGLSGATKQMKAVVDGTQP